MKKEIRRAERDMQTGFSDWSLTKRHRERRVVAEFRYGANRVSNGSMGRIWVWNEMGML